ncbi:RNA polymerase sigma factor [bacterium]|nr:RNA polymerase sigma factor [bacterium]
MNSALEQIYLTQRDRMLSYIRNRVDSIEDAEDILQTVFYQAFRGISVTEPVENLLAWVYRIIKNRIVDWYRRKREVTLPDEGDPFGTLIHDVTPGPENAFLRAEMSDMLVRAIESLPEEQRTVIIMQAIEGYSYREISLLTGVPVNTLLSRKRYAIETMRSFLAETYGNT